MYAKTSSNQCPWIKRDVDCMAASLLTQRDKRCSSIERWIWTLGPTSLALGSGRRYLPPMSGQTDFLAAAAGPSTRTIGPSKGTIGPSTKTMAHIDRPAESRHGHEGVLTPLLGGAYEEAKHPRSIGCDRAVVSRSALKFVRCLEFNSKNGVEHENVEDENCDNGVCSSGNADSGDNCKYTDRKCGCVLSIH